MSSPCLRAGVLIALALAACQSTSPAAGAFDPATPEDAASVALAASPDLGAASDLDATPDLAPVVACGSAPCALPSEGCCTATFGASGACAPAANACPSLAALRFDCDGPEDCPDNKVCCYRPWIGASCAAAPDCAGPLHGSAMCHGDAGCAPMESCCSLGKLAPFAACSTATCVL